MHMVQHMLITVGAAPLLLLGAPIRPLLRGLPTGFRAAVIRPLARAHAIRVAVSLLRHPLVAGALYVGGLYAWHVPALYDGALRHPVVHDLEHACWTGTGLLVWTLLVDPAGHRRLTIGGRLALAVALFAAGQVLTDVLVFSFTPLYPAYAGAHGLSAVTDQQVAGVVMMGEQLLTLGTLAFVLLRPRLRGRASAELAASA